MRILVFDLDDTLYLERDYVRSGFGACDEFVSGRFGKNGFAELASKEFEAGRRHNTFNRVLQSLGVDDCQETVAHLVRVYRQHFPAICVQPDASGLLTSLSGRFPLSLITDGWVSAQQNKIASLGIRPLFDHIVISDEMGQEFRKPHMRPFQAIAQRYPGATSFAYIGDNPHKDFVTPRRLGWHTIRVRRPLGLHAAVDLPGFEADEEVESLCQIKL